MWLPTSHPELWGTQLIWTRNDGVQSFRRGHEITKTETYLNTPGEAVHQKRKPLRWRLDEGSENPPYSLLWSIKEEGGTDYLIVPFHTDHQTEQPWITFATQHADGFSDEDISTLIELCQPLSWKARVTMADMATRSLLGVYLGKSAAQRVLEGEFKRGTGEPIDAVIWFCDLRGFTGMGDVLSSAQLIEVLDHYFECVSEPIEDAGGEILKFIGDAVLAIFPFDEHQTNTTKVCSNALKAAKQALENLKEKSVFLNYEEELQLNAGIALHCGQVFFGNIGGSSRLDFTVIGAAVNEAARVESLCKDTYPILATKTFEKHLLDHSLVSIGHRQLRGVEERHQLFTLKKYIG
jgi:adenylate cyclase